MILGKTLTAIATEKAGIIKTQRPIISAPQSAEALAVLERVAENRSATFGLGGRDWHWAGDNAALTVAARRPHPGLWSQAWEHHDLRIALLGAHQLENASTAVAVAHVLGETTHDGLIASENALVKGLESVRWPGRMEIVRPCDDDNPCILIDGAHNGDSAVKLAAALRAYFKFTQLWLVLGIYADKDLDAIIAPLVPLVTGVWTIGTRGTRSRSASDLAAKLNGLGVQAFPTTSTAEAIRQASKVTSKNDLICVTGSLSIVAEAREALGIVTDDQRDPIRSL